MTKKNNAQLIHQDSGDVEYYTPIEIVSAARTVMGRIDLDPASSAQANLRVRATKIYTAADDGLAHEWHGCIWMNHPFSRQYNYLFIRKLIDEYMARRVEQACCITYASTSEQWYQPLLQFPVCFLTPRTAYVKPDGNKLYGATKGSSVAYLGPNTEKFIDVFRHLGNVMVPAAMWV